jgi:hypothetical protein
MTSTEHTETTDHDTITQFLPRPRPRRSSPLPRRPAILYATATNELTARSGLDALRAWLPPAHRPAVRASRVAALLSHLFFSGTKGHVWSRAPRRTQPDRCSTPTFLMAVTAYRYLGVRSRQAILPGTRLYWKIINRVLFM